MIVLNRNHLKWDPRCLVCVCNRETETERERIILENLITKIVIEKGKELYVVWIGTFIISFLTPSWPAFGYLKWPCNPHVRCTCRPWPWADKTSRVFTRDTLQLGDPWNADTCWGQIHRRDVYVMLSVWGSKWATPIHVWGFSWELPARREVYVRRRLSASGWVVLLSSESFSSDMTFQS